MFGSRRTLAATVFALGTTLSVAHDGVPGTPQEAPVLLRGGTVHTVSDGVRASTDVLFHEGRIVEIGPRLRPSAGARVVDVAGRHVYPGIIGAHSPLGLIEIGAVRATNDKAEVGPLTPEVRARTAFDPDSELIPTIRSHGITTVQVVPGGPGIRGRSFVTHLDGWTVEQSTVLADDALHVDWPAASPGRGWWNRDEKDRKRAQEALGEARHELRSAFDRARAYHTLREARPERDVDLRWEAMRAVFAGGPVHVFAEDAREIREAVELGVREGLEIVIVGGREAGRVVDLLKEHDVAVILRTTAALPLRPDDGYDEVFRLPAILQGAGVRFALTHISWDAGDLRNLPFYAGIAVAFGLSPEQALRAITLSPAEILRIDDDLGSIEVGKEATLFVSEGDVLDPLTQQVTRMWIRGAEVDLDDRHKELFRKYRQK